LGIRKPKYIRQAHELGIQEKACQRNETQSLCQRVVRLIHIDEFTLSLHGEIIRLSETNANVEMKYQALTIEGKPVDEYVFKQDYYFRVGDHRHHSWDSRYWDLFLKITSWAKHFLFACQLTITPIF